MHSSAHRSLVARTLVATGALCATSLASHLAHAQVLSRFHAELEGGFGAMVSNAQRAAFGYDEALQGSVRIGGAFAGPVALQAAYSSWMFPTGNGSGQIHLVGGGLRFEPRTSDQTRIFVDAHAMAAFTGPTGTRVGLDIGAGVEFYPNRWFGIGPVLRYGHVFAAAGDFPADAQFLSLGIGLTFRVPPPLPPPPPPRRVLVLVVAPDTDHDGVPDAADRCPSEIPGAHPDPAQAGCPLRDTDADGVFDPQDACPTTPRGDHPDPDRPGCPDGDADHDGVLDHADACRTEPAGVRPDPARAGCPAADRDHDTVPDASDHCPDQPGAPHPDPNLNGCPGLVLVEPGQLRISQPVQFAAGRETLLPASTRVLEAVANALRASPEIRRVAVEAHTDDQGDDARNQTLSQSRAAAVTAWLVAHGIDAGRLEAHGLGETRPVTSVANLRGPALTAARAQNARVEFRIVDPAPAGTSATPSANAPAP